MRKNCDLFDLVRSMSKSEKRYFRLYCNLQNGEKHYLKLFTSIQSLTTYDEKLLRLQLANHPIAKHWAFNKKYLYDKIIESLGQIDSKLDDDIQINNLIKTFKILKSRGLHSQAMRFLSMSKKKAKKNNKYIKLLEILDLEYIERVFSRTKVVDAKVAHIEEEIKLIFEVIQNYTWARNAFVQMEQWLLKNLVVKSDKDLYAIASIIDQGKKPSKELICKDCTTFYAMALAAYHQAIGNPTRSADILEEHIGLGVTEIKTWQASLVSNYIQFSLQAAATGQAKTLTKCLKLIPYLLPNDQSRYECMTFGRLAIYCNTGEFKEAVSFLEAEIQHFITHEWFMSKRGRFINYYFIAYTYFGNNQLDKASKWILKIVDSDETRISISVCARILQLLILFEKDDYEVLDYKIRSFDRYLKSERIQGPLSKLGRLISLLKYPSTKDTTKINRLADELISQLRNAKFSSLVFHLNIGAWIASKVYKASFKSCIQESIESMNKHHTASYDDSSYLHVLDQKLNEVA